MTNVWIPAFAGMTKKGFGRSPELTSNGAVAASAGTTTIENEETRQRAPAQKNQKRTE